MANRRNFIKKTVAAGSLIGMGLSTKATSEEVLEKLNTSPETFGSSIMGLRVDPIDQVRVGIIGLGMRGMGHLQLNDAVYPKAKIVAICDIREEKVKEALALLKKTNKQKPATYYGKENAWMEMVERDDLDLVLIITPWLLHAPMAKYSMQQGKHAASEVPIALTVEDTWDLVNTAEETQKNCMMLENVCYGEEELWVLNMAQAGVFGELIYGEAAYNHNLRDWFMQNKYYQNWRAVQHLNHDGNLYPTHGLGPVAQYMDILRGDTFQHIVSMSTKSRGMGIYAEELGAEEFIGKKFKHGDMNNSLIKTADDKNILVQHDVISPRPYSRKNVLSGTKAYHEGYPSRISIKGRNSHEFLPENEYQELRSKYKHWIWKKMEEELADNPNFHGGMDYLMTYRVIDCLNNGWPLDQDVYDGAAWSILTPLSEISIELGNVPVRVPDFTRGKWKEARKLPIQEFK
jgi:predicted dehydrogenase